VEIKDKKPERTLSFEEAKEKVKKDFLTDKGKELCEVEAQKLISELKNKNLSNLKNFSVKELRIRRIELEQTFSPDISQKLFNTGKEGILETPLWDKDTLKVLLIKKIIPFEEKPKDEEVLKISSEFLKEKRETWFKTWYQHLRGNAKIKIYPIFEKL
jgi:peptidyl-prolyl cis-trans isomerase D